MSQSPNFRAEIEQAAAYIKNQTQLVPEVVIVTGSGLAGLADEARDAVTIPYGDIPGFAQSTVEGHPGEVVLGRLEGRNVAFQRGRTHFYEGYPLPQVTFPVRVLRALGATTMIVTNAAGGVNPDFRAGDIMLIADHIGLPGMAGNNPLFGANDTRLGPRFPVMAGAYDLALRKLAWRIARENDFPVREGVYCWVAGPSFETPAEIRLLRIIGGDAVGMSTVPEVIVARHAGMRVLGLSLISNAAEAHEPTGEMPPEVHQEVLEASRRTVPRLATLIKGVLRAME
jgi:purine-nucleoside phosphorylase